MDPAFTVAGNKIFDGKMLNAKGEQSGEDAEIEAVDPLLITIDFSRECDDGLLDGDKDGCGTAARRRSTPGTRTRRWS